jgi:hypothetical protein
MFTKLDFLNRLRIHHRLQIECKSTTGCKSSPKPRTITNRDPKQRKLHTNTTFASNNEFGPNPLPIANRVRIHHRLQIDSETSNDYKLRPKTTQTTHQHHIRLQQRVRSCTHIHFRLEIRFVSRHSAFASNNEFGPAPTSTFVSRCDFDLVQTTKNCLCLLSRRTCST